MNHVEFLISPSHGETLLQDLVHMLPESQATVFERISKEQIKYSNFIFLYGDTHSNSKLYKVTSVYMVQTLLSKYIDTKVLLRLNILMFPFYKPVSTEIVFIK